MARSWVAAAAALFAVACGGGSGGSVAPSGVDASAADAAVSPDGGGDAGDASAPIDASASDASDAAPRPIVAYVSGYAPTIGVYDFDAGSLTPASSTTSFGTSPSYLAVNPAVTTLYALDENATGRVGAYAIDSSSGALTFLDDVSTHGDGPAFVGVDGTGKYVLVANYGDGSTAILAVQSDGSLGAAVDTRTVGAHAHMILPDPSNRYVFVPCLGADYVAQFLFDDATGALTANAVATLALPSGSGPRHMAFHPTLPYAYLISETASTMTTLAFDAATGRLSIVETHSTIPMGSAVTNTAAEVRVHPSGKFVYGSNRGDDSVVVFSVDPSSGRLTFVGRTPSGGMTPRDFTLDSTGAYLYAANQGSNDVVPFRVDATAGTLTASGAPLSATAASFVGLVLLPAP